MGTTQLKGVPCKSFSKCNLWINKFNKEYDYTDVFNQKSWDFPRFGWFCALNPWISTIYLYYSILLYMTIIYIFTCIYMCVYWHNYKHFPRWLWTIRSETSEPNHFLIKKTEFSRRVFFNREWPPMLINREWPTPSSIAKHFCGLGCWSIRAAYYMIWT